MVADKPQKDLASTLYAEWISAGVKLSLVGLETTAKMFASTRQTVVAKKSEAPVKQKTSSKMATSAVGELTDLKLISGVGPKLEILLKSNGILSVNQIAAWSEGEALVADKAVNLGGRTATDKWVDRARELVRSR